MGPAEHRIERLGHKGDGIAPGPVFAARTLPGEVVAGEVVDGRIARPTIVTPSADRVRPPCRHYRTCGGCSLQHVRDDFVSAWKQDVVREALAANGLDAPLRRFHLSPPESRRRAVFSGRRTKSGAIVGFHGPQSELLTGVPDCLVITPALRDALPVLERLVSLGASRKGEVKLSVTETSAGLDVDLAGGHALGPALHADLVAAVAEAGVARLTWDKEPVLQHAVPFIDIDGHPVPLPPGAFLQATREGEAALRASVLDGLSGVRGPVVDLFAGLGTFTLPAARSNEVHAVEGDAALMGALDQGWRRASGLRQVTTETRDLFRRPLLTDELARFAAIVIDPPRAGATAQVTEIAKARVARVAHVSCNPVTFARDAATLVTAGYRIGWIDVVDQFRWSSHIELVALFEIATS